MTFDGLKPARSAADGLDVTRLTDRLRRPYAVLIATIAAVDVTYRLLLRGPIRRSLGIEAERPAPSPPRARAVRVPPSPRRQSH